MVITVLIRSCFFLVEKGPAADAAVAPLIVQPCDEYDEVLSGFPCNGTPVE